MKVFVATWPFDSFHDGLVEMLTSCGCEVHLNPSKRRLKKDEIPSFVADAQIVIAGTEPYTVEVLRKCTRLQLISRVGIGLDSVDLEHCSACGTRVAYTPDAPSRAVAELTIHHMLALVRRTRQSHSSVVSMAWERHMGELISEHQIGLLGFGRIGHLVAECLRPFNASVAAHDIAPDLEAAEDRGVSLVSCEELFGQSTLLSIHIPLNASNRHFVSRERIEMMPPGAFLVNTSRGAVVDEIALESALSSGRLRGVALDVFESEPYVGSLRHVENVVLSAHIGASARAARREMELEAVRAVEAFVKGLPWANYAV